MVDKSVLCKIACKELPWIALMVGFICVTVFACYYTSWYFRDLDDKRIDNVEDRLHRIEAVTGTYPLGDMECENEDDRDDEVPQMSSSIQRKHARRGDLSKVRAQSSKRVRPGRK